jgi:hypothetical protein
VSERLEARAEVLKLARILSAQEEELGFLAELPTAELREFRESVTNRLFDSSSKLLERIAAAAKLIPSGLIATIAERAFGPLLCARAAGAVDTAKAIDVAKRLPAEFLADTTIELDPRRVAPIIAAVPGELVVKVARVLGERHEYVTMGRFLAFVTDSAIVSAIGVLDDEALLRTAFVLEHKDRLDHALGLLPPERLPGVVLGATALELWPEALDLLGHLCDATRVRLAADPAFHDPEILDALVRAAAAAGLWVDLVPLIDVLPEWALDEVPPIAAALEPELISTVIRDAARAYETLPTLLGLVARMDGEQRQPIIELIGVAERDLAEDLVAAFGDPELAGPLVELLTLDVRTAIERAATRLGMEAELERALARGDRSG